MFHGLAELVTHGGWGFAAIFLVGIGYMYIAHRKELQAVEKRHRDERCVHDERTGMALDSRYNDVCEMVSRSTEVIVSARDQLRRVEEELARTREVNMSLSHHIESLEKTIQRCDK